MRSLLPGPRAVLVPVLSVMVVLGAACSSARQHPRREPRRPSPSIVHSGHVTITIRNYAFVPQTTTVRAGTRVTWVNADTTAHTATADDSAFDTGTIEPHATHSIVLHRPGTYAYHCVFHAFMTATIRVIR